MFKEKKSFFERLAGNSRSEEQEVETETWEGKLPQIETSVDDETDGELSVDVYENNDEIIIEAMVAGVKPDNLSLSIMRDVVTIRGKREANTTISEESYYLRELYWGTFSRVINLPHEIEPEEAEAIEKHGLLIIRLPKIDKEKQTKLKVKSI